MKRRRQETAGEQVQEPGKGENEDKKSKRREAREEGEE